MDEQASAEFETLYNKYFNQVFSFLYRLCRDHHTAEELTQETFLEAYISIHRFKGDCEMSTWLISIAKHIFGKYLRKAKKSPGTVELDSLAETMFAPKGEGPETAYIRQCDARGRAPYGGPAARKIPGRADPPHLCGTAVRTACKGTPHQ